MAKLRTYEALAAILAYFTAGLPAEVTAIGGKSRIQDWIIGRRDPMALEAYDAMMIAPIPERVGPIGDEQTVSVPLDLCFAAQGTERDEVSARLVRYGDAAINLIEPDHTLGGSVFGCTAHNPEILLPALGESGIGWTVVRLIIELNLLGG